MPVSFMKMSNSHKSRHEQMQKKLENVIKKRLQKQAGELLKQTMKRIQKRKKGQGRVKVRRGVTFHSLLVTR